METNFDSTTSTPYITAPSSPQRIGNLFFSAPTSPRINSPVSNQDLHRSRNHDEIEDFEFNFSGQLDRNALSAADELFDRGKIRPLKPNTDLSQKVPIVSSPKSKVFARKCEINQEGDRKQESRGRDRGSSSYVHKGSRSLSPLRVSNILLENEDDSRPAVAWTGRNSNKSYLASIFASFSSKNYKKWKLKDLLLFRSVSEGRAESKKYVPLSKKEDPASKIASFRSGESVGSVSDNSGLKRKGGPTLSAHEIHYTENRAVSEELKKKTFLPYKQGWLGCLRFNPGANELSRGVGSMTRV